jgi:hypothetical protein
MGDSIEVLLDGKLVEDTLEPVPTGKLTVRLIPDFFKVFDCSPDCDPSFAMFETSIEKPLSAEEVAKSIKDKHTSITYMGDIPSLRIYGEKEIELHLKKPDMVYDFFLTVVKKGEGYKDVRGYNGHRRIIMVDLSERTPHSLTYDEMKFLVLEGLGLSLEDAKGIPAIMFARKESYMKDIPQFRPYFLIPPSEKLDNLWKYGRFCGIYNFAGGTASYEKVYNKEVPLGVVLDLFREMPPDKLERVLHRKGFVA